MANIRHNLLTAGKVKSLSEPGTYTDGEGLTLRVADNGAKSWVLRATIDGKRRNIGVGSYPSVGLAEARRISEKHRQSIREGIDPVAEKRRTRLEESRPAMPTFKESTFKFLGVQSGIKSDKHRKNWIQMMEKYAFPPLGSMRLDEIDRQDVLAVLEPIWKEKAETARRIRQRMKAVFEWGMAHGYIENNPAGERISGALPKQERDVNHFRALPYSDLPNALNLIRENSKAITLSRLALELVAFTACRSGEVRGARWSEIDWERKLWIIPADRMKMDKEHRVPLTAPALDVLRQALAVSGDGDLVFPSPLKQGHPLSDMTLTKILRTAGLADRMTVHGIRSTFRDWCAEETATPWAVAELSLAHQVGNSVEQAYHRTDLLEKRRELMEAWAAFLTGAGRPVVESK